MILFCFLDGIGADFRSLLVVESVVAIQQFDPGGHRSRLDPELVEISNASAYNPRSKSPAALNRMLGDDEAASGRQLTCQLGQRDVGFSCYCRAEGGSPTISRAS